MSLQKLLILWVALFASNCTAIYDFHAPRDAGLLQNVVNPKQCLTVAGVRGDRLVLSPCDLVNIKQLIDFTDFSTYATAPWLITFHANQKVMQVSDASTSDGDPIQLVPFDPSNTGPHQRWRIVNGSWDGEFHLQAGHSGKCLTPQGRSDVVQAVCASDAGWRVLQWPRVPFPRSYLLKNAADPDFCLDNYRRRLENGATAGLYRCNPSHVNHHWYFDEPEAYWPAVLIRNRVSSKCLQVNRESTQNGARVTQWTCPSATQTRPPRHFFWNITSPDPGASPSQRLVFENVNAPGKCLSEEIGRWYADISTCTRNATRQLWMLVSPAQYMLPFGAGCDGDIECLSGSCATTCGKGAKRSPCQTKEDCETNVCTNGTCEKVK